MTIIFNESTSSILDGVKHLEMRSSARLDDTDIDTPSSISHGMSFDLKHL